jgi:hypothetical protein
MPSWTTVPCPGGLPTGCGSRSFGPSRAAAIPPREGVNVVGIGLSDPLVGMYLGTALWIAPRPEPRPRAVNLLSMSSRDHLIRRADDRTLESAIVDGTLLEGAFANVVRTRDAPLRTGDVIPLGAWTVRILDDIEGQPTRFSVTFDRPVDDPSIALVVWQDGAVRALEPPRDRPRGAPEAPGRTDGNLTRHRPPRVPVTGTSRTPSCRSGCGAPRRARRRCAWSARWRRRGRGRSRSTSRRRRAPESPSRRRS